MYRLLNENDTMSIGDEWYEPLLRKWIAINENHILIIGKYWSEMNYPTRRKINAKYESLILESENGTEKETI